MVSSLFVVLFPINNAIIAASNRWESPFLNVVGRRILTNPEYLSYFESRGMPVNDALLELKGELSYGKDLAFYVDPRLTEFRSWVKENGLREFARFLWFYKADTLQLPLHEPQEIINPDLYYYTGTGYRPIVKDQRLREILYPIRFGELGFLLANLVAASLIFPAFYYRQPLWMIPLMLILFSYPQAVLMWNADPHDIGRHSLYHNIEWRLGIWLAVLFVGDFIFVLLGRKT